MVVISAELLLFVSVFDVISDLSERKFKISRKSICGFTCIESIKVLSTENISLRKTMESWIHRDMSYQLNDQILTGSLTLWIVKFTHHSTDITCCVDLLFKLSTELRSSFWTTATTGINLQLLGTNSILEFNRGTLSDDQSLLVSHWMSSNKIEWFKNSFDFVFDVCFRAIISIEVQTWRAPQGYLNSERKRVLSRHCDSSWEEINWNSIINDMATLTMINVMSFSSVVSIMVSHLLCASFSPGYMFFAFNKNIQLDGREGLIKLKMNSAC